MGTNLTEASQGESPDSTRHVASPTNTPLACTRPVAGCMVHGAGRRAQGALLQVRVRAQTSSRCMCTAPNWCRAKSCSPDLDITRMVSATVASARVPPQCPLFGLQAARVLLSGTRVTLSKRAGSWSGGWPRGLLRAF